MANKEFSFLSRIGPTTRGETMIRINDSKSQATLKAALLSVFLLFMAVAGYGQQQINLTAAPTTTTLPDGTTVPMWGYSCGTAVTGSTATCAALNPAAVANPLATTWSPVVITVPTGQGLTINLTNNLSFTPAGSTTANNIPTSIVIVGQVGGGLGVTAQRTTTTSPDHSNAQGCVSWFIAGIPPGTPCTSTNNQKLATPPVQGLRVQSMATEVAAGAVGSATAVPLTWTGLKPGTYLLESGTHPSIQVPMGLIGVLVVTTPPTAPGATGTAYPATATSVAVPYNAEVVTEFSEIDPVQNREVDTAVRTAGFSETMVWSGMPTGPQGTPGCGYPGSTTYHQCYPPAVNYTPFYYLINGVAFNTTSPTASEFMATAGPNTATPPALPNNTTGITGTVLVRIVNAGLRLHVPSIVNSLTQGFNGAGAAATVSGFSLIAEDGNVLPNVAPLGATTVPAAPRVQTDVLMVPGKVYDALVNVPPAGATATPDLPIYDRQLSLSGNSSERDSGMLAYISVNNATAGAGLPVQPGSGIFAAAQANPDSYLAVAACGSTATSCMPLVVSDVSKGVIANDVNVYGVSLLTAPSSGTLTCPSIGNTLTTGTTSNTLCANGTFIYTPNPGFPSTGDSFTYCANNAFTPASGTTAAACSSTTLTAKVTLGASTLSGNPTVNNITYTAHMASFLKIPSPGVLSVDSDPNGLPLQVVTSSVTTTSSGLTINMDPQGGFTASLSPGATTAPVTAQFTYVAQNSQGGQSSPATVTINFPVPSNLKVNVLDAQAYNDCNGNTTCIASLVSTSAFSDYRWIIEEDRTFWVDPNCTTSTTSGSTFTVPAGCPGPVAAGGTIPVFGVNFHTSSTVFVAQGCTGPLSCEGGQTMVCGVNGAPACPSGHNPGDHIPAVCDLGNGACRFDSTGNGFTPVFPSQVALDPAKRYYISVLPGDAGSPFPSYTGTPVCNGKEATTVPSQCGHTMSGAPIPPACNVLGGTNACTTASAFQPVNVLVLPTPLPTGKLSVIVFEDDFPLNGEQDGGGGGGVVAPVEPGLGGFQIILWDTYGGLGDVTGQDTYDMFNQPLSNSLAGTIDPATGLDACPISPAVTANVLGTGNNTGPAGPPTTANPNPIGAQAGITGTIVTCPKYESDNATLSPLAGQAVVANLMPDKFSVQAYPGADRIARGEEWLQTNTLDGQHPHDSFIRIGEPSYFQEYGPAGYHVAIGFANPAIINARHDDVCKGLGTPGAVGSCTAGITGQVDVQRLSRIPDERLYPSGTRDALGWTQCWVSLGDPDGEDFMFTKCDANGNFSFTGVPGGNWRLTIGDQWNDQIIDGLSTPANTVPGQTLALGNIGVQQWQANLYTRTFVDDNKNGIWDSGEIGIPLIYTMIHYRDGSRANALTTDFNGIASFNETFPLFNWYVVEADAGRYKTTGIHTVYDAGGPADGTSYCGASGARLCGTSTAYAHMTNTFEAVPLPSDLSVPGAVYCAKADCMAEATSFAAGTAIPSSSTASTGRIDPPWVWAEGWAGLTGHSNYIDFGKAPYASCPPACATVTSTAAGATAAVATATLTGGTGYNVGDVINLTGGGGSGATMTVTAVSGGTITSASLTSGGAGYTSAPTGTTDVTTPAGSGAVLTATLANRSTTTQVAENGGIYGQIQYASTRPFDDAGQMVQQPWEPYVPNVTVNLYQEGFAADGVTPTLTLVDTTQSSSFDDWAQGFYPNGTAGTGSGAGQKPYMSCPGQGQATGANADLFWFTLYDQPNYLDWYNSVHNGGTLHTLPYNSQFKCYDAMKINNQIQPAPYDGRYSFPSSTGINPTNGKPTGTNCTICVPNPDSTDAYRFGTPMLPPGKYVVQVVMPPGYEVYKEEDKNLLIGDNLIAPVTVQFAGLGGDVFIIPDQANVASLYDPNANGVNSTNYQDQTQNLSLQGGDLSGVPGFPGYQDPVWPCVGEQRTVPDFLSLFPRAQEVAPFAGAVRPLCDRKEVTLENQMSVRVKFALFTSTHIASHYTGVITDDLTSEFDPFSPQFGEKFAPPNMPISTKDYLGNELSRVYSDHWGLYNGLTFSSWDVNPPNITGYSPSMMVQCMNDPGPIPGANGTTMNDPLYNPAYSDFCYEEPYMPGTTTYLDTPVVPTQGFVGAAYNNPDCSYPDATPAIAEVDGDGIGPWVSKAGVTLTITALGDQQVSNSAYAGPSATVAPFNMKTITRHYGFGTQCLSPTAGSTTCNTLSSVTIGGRPATIDSWSDTAIQVTVPSGVPNCAIQQQAQYQGTLPSGQSATAQCGQLLITAGNGKQSIDSVTVTIGGKTPTHVSANQTIQAAIDAAAPGDLIIVDPTCTTAGTSTTATCSISALHAATPTETASVAAHQEMVLMWKPVRLQGVGAASSVIDANAIPAGKLLNPWRRHVNCLFGLTLQGRPTLGLATGVAAPPYDSTSTYSCPDTSIPGDTWNYFTTPSTQGVPQIDRIPLEAVEGWDATLNGNLAEQLQEPALMGAYEGAGITVLAKGVVTPTGVDIWSDGAGAPGAFPPGTVLLQDVPAFLPAVPAQSSHCADSTNPYPSNFECNPSSIDGLTIRDSSQGGGGIFAHGWTHNLQIANNRVYNNAGTLSGGISVGQGEFPSAQTITSVVGGVGQQSTLTAPPSCQNSNVVNTELPFCLDLNVNVHNNYITNNSSLGDELFSGTLAGGGGVTFCTGADYYKFNNNWVCGNLATGEGGGLVHLGYIYNGDIEHNSIVLNQSTNPTISTNGGGIMVQGTPDTDPVCGTIIDADCPPGVSDGTGPGLVINGNLIQGNMAESGSGGGIRLQGVNGTEVSLFPSTPTAWNSVSITNNMIVNNVAGWDGAGISLQDSLNVAIINNTISSNDSLASAGVLTQSIGTPLASAPPGNCVQAGTQTSCPQSAGVTSMPNTVLFAGTYSGLTLTCPNGQSNCAAFSNPLLANNVIWQNRSFDVGVATSASGPTGTGTQNQQNLVSLFPTLAQTASGFCATGASYWDIGVRGDTGPGNHASGYSLNPTYSVLDDTGYAASNVASNPSIVSQYCNGSRVPPECTVADGCGGPNGYGVPPGIVDAQTPNPVFTLTPSATVDEGNNWINVSWGPLALSNDAMLGPTGNYGGGNAFGNYALNAGSPAIDYVPLNSTTLPTGTIPQLSTDFYGNPRPDAANPSHFDVGAVEFQNGSGVGTLTSISPSSGQQGTVVNVTLTGTNLTLASAVNVSGTGIAVSNVVAVNATTVTATFTIAPNATLSARNVTVTTPAGTSNAVTFTVVAPPAPTLTSLSPNFELRGTAVNVTLTGTNFVNGATVVATPAVPGFNISSVTFVNATTITATFSSTTSTAIGNVNIEVVTSGGGSNTLPFAINGPVLNSIAPNSANQGSGTTPTVVNVTLTGSGLTGTTAVNVSGNGFTVTNVVAVNDTTVTATFAIASNATGGARNVTTTSAAGTSNAVTFTVIVPPGALTSISPNTGARGTSVAVILSGTRLTGSTGINVNGGGITVSGFNVVSDTQINATFTISATAALTARNVTVSTAGGVSNPVTFTVVSPGTPTLSSISPNSGLRGAAVFVTLTGTGFTAAGTTVNVAAPAGGLTISGVTVVNPTTITATFSTFGGATIGPRSIFVTTPGGSTGTVTYTVTGPVLTSISPASGTRGTAVPVSLFGSGLTGTTAINVSGGGGITVSGLTVVNDTQVNATFTISAFTGAGARNVTVTAPGGTSNAVTFTVTVPPAPTLTSIAPPTGVRGTAVAVTLTGSNFISGATTVAVSGGGVAVSGVTVTSTTQISATFTISTGAALGVHNVSVTTPGGTSNTVPFTVQGATLTSISPNNGARGTTVPVTFTGANLTGATAVTGLGGGGTGVTFNSLTVVNSTTVTANLVISGGATLGILNLGLATPIGNTNTIPFTVQNPPAATLASALNNATGTASATRPAAGSPALAVTVTLTGTNFTSAGTTVNGFTGVGGITTTVTSSTSITVSFNLSSGATAGARSITVTTPAGTTTPAVTFTIN
jgi:hypothetical protein